MFYRLFILISVIFFSGYAISGKEIIDTMDKLLMIDEGELTISIVDRRSGVIRTTLECLVLYKKDRGTLIEFTAPPREKKKKILTSADNMWMSVPGVSRPIRVSGKESFMGTSFTNNDLTDYSKSNEYVSAIIDSTDSLYTVQMISSSKTVSYPKVIATVTHDCMPVRQELYTLSGSLIKTITFSEIRQLAGRLRPSVFTVTDMLTKGNNTYVKFNSMTPRKISESAFSPDNLSE